jgi:MoaA/NifB/PqqE/SkfB family radical SAM enzyme
MRIVSHGDLTIRLYGNDCVVIAWRDGSRVAVDGARACLVHALVEAGCTKVLADLRTLSDPPRTDEMLGEAFSALTDMFGPSQRPVPSTSVADLLHGAPALARRARQDRIPLIGLLELTYQCNLRCQHCYLLHLVTQPSPTRLDDTVIKQVLHDLIAAGITDITISGGEATLVPAYRDYIAECKDRGVYTILKTNGTTFSRKRASDYARDPAHETHVSMYGGSATTHDALTGRRGSFALTVRGLSHLADAGIRCTVYGIVWKGNLAEVEAQRSLIQELGHTAVFDARIYGRLNGDTAPIKLQISPYERSDLIERGFLLREVPSRCAAGAMKVRIGANGGVSTCELLPAEFGNVTERRFADIWESQELVGYSRSTIAIADRAQASEGDPAECPGIHLLNVGYRDPARLER